MLPLRRCRKDGNQAKSTKPIETGEYQLTRSVYSKIEKISSLQQDYKITRDRERKWERGPRHWNVRYTSQIRSLRAWSSETDIPPCILTLHTACVLYRHTVYLCTNKRKSHAPFFGIVVFQLPWCNYSIGNHGRLRHSDTHGVTQAGRRRDNCRGRCGVGGSQNNTK